jgi:4-alpha-glucanotransferase
MRHAGGIRIDHAMGLQRLWLIPEGGRAIDGVYLAYPFRDLLALVARESRRAKAVVIAEDLGTVPKGFRDALAGAGVLGMRVLPFQRDAKGGFRDATRWDSEACALTGTHDLATVAGWWSGRDIDWRTRISSTYPATKVRRERDKERKLLWRALEQEKNGLVPGPRREQDVVDAAIAFVARTLSKLALFPIEDIAGLVEQPNLPGTTNEHPNWRRRLPSGNGLHSTRAKKRMAVIAKERAT